MARRANLVAALLVVICFLTYAFLRSPYLDDFDSVNFALALTDFDLMQAQPHPPGYPIYILLARLIRPLFATDAAALTFISALAGGVGVGAFLILCRVWMGAALSVLAAGCLALVPCWAIDSLKAMTDIPGLALTLVLLAYLVVAEKRQKPLSSAAVGLLFGIAAGVRLHLLLIHIVFYWFWVQKRTDPARRNFFYGLLLGLSLWIVPTILVFGAELFFLSHWKMMTARWGVPSISLLGSRPSLSLYLGRAGDFFQHFLSEGWGFTLESPLGVASGLVLAGVLYFFVRCPAPGKETVSYARFERAFLYALIPYTCFIFVYLPAMNARYMVPWIPLLILGSFVRMPQVIPYRACLGVGVLWLIALAPNSYVLARTLQQTPPPPQQLIQHVNSLDWTKQTDMVVGASRYFAYFPVNAEYKLMRLVPCKELVELLQLKRRVWMDEPTHCSGVRQELVATFLRDRRVHYKAHFIHLYRTLPGE